MKAEIEIINVLKYENEKGKGTRVNFRMIGEQYVSKYEKLKGYANLDAYYSNHDVFAKIPVGFCGAKVTAEFIPDPNNSDPLHPRQIIKSLSCNDTFIELL